jgi:NAD-dependent dihydropyrimidine dehydrogenase PreA subunit
MRKKSVLTLLNARDLPNYAVCPAGCWTPDRERPKVIFHDPQKCIACNACVLLSSEAGAQEIVDYAHRHPFALRELASFMGYRLNGTQEDIRALGLAIPMFVFQPGGSNEY